jgi:NADH-quinone oxidoreductase subunit J
MNLLLTMLGLLTIGSAAGVVFSYKSLNSGLWLVVTLFLIAVHFVLLDAEFIGALQVLVYAGAIMVLFVFVILLLGLNERAEPRRGLLTAGLSFCSAAGFFATIYIALERKILPPAVSSAAAAPSGGVAEIGALIFTKYLVPFELTSLLILAALIGAVVLAYEPRRGLPAGRGLSTQAARLKEGN